MNSNGVLSFNTQFTSCCGARDFPRPSPPLIAPFWHDFDPRRGGRIYYRQTNQSDQLRVLHQLVECSPQCTGEPTDFYPTQLFIATWDQVPQFGGQASVS